jgi:microcystin degradation protein MlrC
MNLDNRREHVSPRIFTACLGTETNSFSPIPTGLGLFEHTMLVRNGEFGERVNLFGLPLIVWRDRAAALGWQVTQGLAAFATPAGDTTRAAYETLRDEILADLEQALPVDAVMLNLHGAMVAEGYPDAEGDLLQRVRQLIGPDIPLLAELDLHGHQTQLKLDSADVLVYFKHYPHVDAEARAHELFDIAQRMVQDGLRPRMAMHNCRMLGIFPTTREPLQGFVSHMQEVEGREGILSVSLVHGFPWSNMPDIGTRVVVVAESDQSLAERTAAELGDWVWQHRDDIIAPFCTLDNALDRVAAATSTGKPLVLADMADNTGLGAAGDSTFVIQRLLERDIGGVAVSPLWDPVAVELAFDAGMGATLKMRIGGKLGAASGQPLDLTVTVMGLTRDATQQFGGGTQKLGDVAWLRVCTESDGAVTDEDAIDIIVNSVRVQAFDPECFSAAGLDPMQPRALVVKSTQHFYAGFAPIAEEVLYVATPGCGSMMFSDIEHPLLQAKLWPREDNPHI